jgi:DNA ligase (NAD+)
MIKKMNDLIEQLNYATQKYDAGAPIMSDEQWDDLYFTLISLELESGMALPNSPTQRIHYDAVNQLVKIEHNHKMLSLEKTKEIDEINAFVKNKVYLAMCKMDGLTCSVRYLGGRLVSAETRGNGLIGEDILHNARVIPSIPNNIKYKGELVLDGEIICTYSDFESFSDEYKNPRNFAAGSIRLLDPKECEKRKLQFVVWDVMKGFEHVENCDLNYLLDLVDSLGFITVPRIVSQAEITEDLIEQIKTKATEKSYPIDGAVFKFNDIAYGKSLGETAHHFKNAMAFKFYDETYPTTLRDIEWTMGRTGVLTPIAIFVPIDIDGSTVERASLHNISVMKEMLGGNPHVGQKVEVFKANMIIPQIATAEKESQGTLYYMEHPIFDIPDICPICGSPTTQRTDIDSTVLVCTNDMCEGKLINRLDHFCGKKGLDIKGLSKATLEKLMDWGWVNSITDLYQLRDYGKEWMSKPGFGLKSVSNILNAIEASRDCTLQAFICSLGIPLIGSTASKELCRYFSSWDEFRDAVSSNFKFFSLDGFGIEMHNALKEFDYSIADTLAEDYLNVQEIVKVESADSGSANSLTGVTVVITGKLTQFKNRSELQNEIESRGGKVVGSVSKNTTYLINNDNTSASAKNVSAQKLGIPVLTELDFIEQFLTN